MMSDVRQLDALNAQSNRLLKTNQLCIELIVKYRHHLMTFNKRCICGQNSDNSLEFTHLEEEYYRLDQLIGSQRMDSCDNECNSDILGRVCDNTSEVVAKKSSDKNNTIELTEEEVDTRSQEIIEEFDRTADKSVLKSKKTVINGSNSRRMKTFVCHWMGCDKSYAKSSQLKTHLSNCHTIEGTYRCNECDKYFVSEPILHKHHKNHKRYTGAQYVCQCPNCPFVTAFEKSLRRHEWTHSDVRRFKCDETDCQKCFKSKQDLKSHVIHMHRNERPFVCEWPGCGQAFKLKQLVTDHRLIHLNERQFKCDIKGCLKSFNTRSVWRAHRKRHERTGRPFVCQWPGCERTYKTNTHLKCHMNSHLDVKPHECHYDGCTKRYFTKSELNQHILIVHNKSHANDYKCEFEGCVKAFPTYDYLAKHRRRHEKRLACDWADCERRFATKQDLTDHMNRHQNIREICPLNECAKSFFGKSNLLKHIKSAHKM